jgi:protein translocase SecG subunit
MLGVFVFVCAALIIVVLLQSGKGASLAGALGGGGASSGHELTGASFGERDREGAGVGGSRLTSGGSGATSGGRGSGAGTATGAGRHYGPLAARAQVVELVDTLL